MKAMHKNKETKATHTGSNLSIVVGLILQASQNQV